jgi:hypothetical protein
MKKPEQDAPLQIAGEAVQAFYSDVPFGINERREWQKGFTHSKQEVTLLEVRLTNGEVLVINAVASIYQQWNGKKSYEPRAAAYLSWKLKEPGKEAVKEVVSANEAEVPKPKKKKSTKSRRP